MKQLSLLRHADSIKILDPSNDYDRTITKKGISQIQSLCDDLSMINFKCDLVLCSSSTRTTQTFEMLSKYGHYNFTVNYLDSLYNASLEDMISIIQNVADKNSSILVIGHNPTISECARYITNNNLLLDPGNFICLDLPIASWKHIDQCSAEVQCMLPKK